MEKPTKEQLKENLRLLNKWVEAISCCTFPGRYCAELTEMTVFFKNQEEVTRKQYEAAIEPPKWGKPEPVAVAQ
jgi:hypothetical protein